MSDADAIFRTMAQFGQKGDQGLVGPAFQRWRLNLDLDALIVQALDGGTARAGLQVAIQDQAAVTQDPGIVVHSLLAMRINGGMASILTTISASVANSGDRSSPPSGGMNL